MCTRLNVVARVIIGIVSFLFGALAYAIMLLGVVTTVQPDARDSLWRPLISTAISEATAQAPSSVVLPTDSLVLDNLVGGVSDGLIVLGAVLSVVTILGVATSCCMMKLMAIIYLVMTSLLTLAFLIVVIIVSLNRSIVTDPARASLKSSLQSQYQGLNGTDSTSSFWNTIMIWKQCCGVDSYKDFDSATQWQADFGNGSTLGYASPAVCCKTGLYDPPITVVCAVSPTVSNSNMDVGCYDKLLDSVLTGTPFIGFSCGTVGSSTLLSICAAVILYHIIHRSRKEGSWTPDDLTMKEMRSVVRS